MKLPAEKPDKQALFNAALAEADGGPAEGAAATTPKKRAAKKAAPEAAEPAADEAPAEAASETPAES
jgi:small subunit ribosomal protein S16